MDQAEKLRRLSKATIVESKVAIAQLPMVVIAGARNGVGATTVTVNLAAAIADRGVRVLVIDAAESGNDLADVAGVSRSIEYNMSDIISGKCGIVDALIDGPRGSYILASRSQAGSQRERAARRQPSTKSEHSRIAQQRLLGEIDSLNNEIDLTVVDVGAGLTAWTRRLWLQAQCVVLVTTADDGSVMDAYAAIKTCGAAGIRPNIRLLVNRELNEAAAEDAQRRVQNACRKFLSLPLEALPVLPMDENAFGAGASSGPRVWEEPNSSFGRATLWLARAISDVLAKKPGQSSVAAFSKLTPFEMFMQATDQTAT